MEHTPGPWTATQLSAGIWIHAKQIALPDTMADARLMAAAPELLAALEKIIKYFEYHDGELHHSQDRSRANCTVCSARLAIEKARKS